jgi:hypothetical protein
MKMNINTGEIFTDNNKFLKKLQCTQSVDWQTMQQTEKPGVKRCNLCSKTVTDINNLSDKDLLAIFAAEPNACVTFNLYSKSIQIIEQ